MQYTVALKNISENDQLVLRLIFSLSAKARGRVHTYCLYEDAQAGHADLCIRTSDSSVAQEDLAAPNMIWLDGDSGNGLHHISKPLIASRVLGVLDRVVAALPSAAAAPAVTTTVSVPDTAQDAAPAIADDMEFCISEEEASQLAIVDDEALSNPANQPAGDTNENTITAITDNIQKEKTGSLIVLHNNQEIEVSKQAFDNRASEAATGDLPPRALVVDDSPSVRKQIELELNLFNVDADYAATMAEAMTMLEDNHYDIAFLDVVLPDGDGFRICRSIKQTPNGTRVIMLTGKATPADKVKGTMAGCDAYLVKPVGRMTFQNTVCNYLQLREQLEVIHA
ncbi:MAG: response regulator [Gammaproteobacteria bacterium]|nr:response regulator [Gammaproteobacteria bacterium]